MEKNIIYVIGNNKFIFSLESLYLLNELLYDSQIVVSNFKEKSNENNFIFEVCRADYNRMKFINFYFFKLCFIKETKSKLSFIDVVSVDYIMKDEFDFNTEKFETIYSIEKKSNDSVFIDTEKFNINIKLNGKIELIDRVKTTNNYLKLINSTGLDFKKWFVTYQGTI